MKIYENANDQHVRKVVLYEVGGGLAFDEDGTELLTKEQIVDAFLKGCVVENEGNYKTPTGVNVTDSGAELVFGGSGSGGPELENAIATHGMGWTESEPKEGFDITWDGDTEGLDVVDDDNYKVSDIIEGLSNESDLIGAKIILYNQGSPIEGTISEESILTEDGKVFALDIGQGQPFVYVAFENGTYDDGYLVFSKGIWLYNMYGATQIYTARFYKEASTEEVVHQIDQKYIPSGGSGGGMVVHFELDETTGEVSADKTPSEVLNAMSSESVVGVLTLSDSVYPIGAAFASMDGKFIAFYSYHGLDESPMPLIIGSVQTGVWEGAQ